MAQRSGGTPAGTIPIVNDPIRPKSGQARNRQDKLQNYWKKQLPTQRYQDYDFRATLIRREKSGALRVLSLDRVQVGVSWDETSPNMAASVTLMNPNTDTSMPVREGHEIKVDWSVAGQGRWHNLFRLRVDEVVATGSSGAVECKLVDELEWASRSKDDWSFKKGKKNRPKTGKRTKGWRADQIAREVCRRAGIPVGKLAKGQHLIKNLTEEDMSPVAVITKAYKLDRENTGRRFVISMKNGRLTVTQLRRSSDLLLVGEHLIEATLQRSLKKSFATIVNLTATGRKEKGKRKREKIEVEVRSGDTAMARYGRIRATWSLEDPVGSEAEARQKAKRKLARSQEPNQSLTMTLPGIPTLKRGDALKVKLDQLGLSELIYIAGVTHRVDSGGNYTMDVTAGFEDPFEDTKGDEIREELCKKARKHKRKPPYFCEPGFDPAAPRRHVGSGQARNRRDRTGLQTNRPVSRR